MKVIIKDGFYEGREGIWSSSDGNSSFIKLYSGETILIANTRFKGVVKDE